MRRETLRALVTSLMTTVTDLVTNQPIQIKEIVN